MLSFIKGELDCVSAEILDLNEDRYRNGEWNIKLFGMAKTLLEPNIIQQGKHLVESASDDEIKEDIAEFIKEEMEENKDTLYIMGPGSTVETISSNLELENTLLGVDAVYENKNIGSDLNEQALLKILEKHPKAKLLLSPIGAQGFILGRGNLQLSPKVIGRIGIDNIEIISTPAKLAGFEFLRVDTNDPALDKEFEKKEYLSVIIGYRQRRMKKLMV
jgi:predicted polyphosphate/ATP-dependent NAD kinase